MLERVRVDGRYRFSSPPDSSFSSLFSCTPWSTHFILLPLHLFLFSSLHPHHHLSNFSLCLLLLFLYLLLFISPSLDLHHNPHTQFHPAFLALGNVVDPLSVIEGGGNQKENPAYGADTLRLWVSGKYMYGLWLRRVSVIFFLQSYFLPSYLILPYLSHPIPSYPPPPPPFLLTLPPLHLSSLLFSSTRCGLQHWCVSRRWNHQTSLWVISQTEKHTQIPIRWISLHIIHTSLYYLYLSVVYNYIMMYDTRYEYDLMSCSKSNFQKVPSTLRHSVLDPAHRTL